MSRTSPKQAYKTFPPDTRFVVRDEDWKRVWAANVTEKVARAVTNMVANRRLSRTPMFETMPDDRESLKAIERATLENAAADHQDGWVNAAVQTGAVRSVAAPAQAPEVVVTVGEVRTVAQQLDDLSAMTQEMGGYPELEDVPSGSTISDLLGSEETLDDQLAAADPAATFEEMFASVEKHRKDSEGDAPAFDASGE